MCVGSLDCDIGRTHLVFLILANGVLNSWGSLECDMAHMRTYPIGLVDTG